MKNLREKECKLDLFDICVANKQIENKKHTVLSYIDDMKMSHEDKEVNLFFIIWLKRKYEKLRLSREKFKII